MVDSRKDGDPAAVVLCSGGLDSAVLVAAAARDARVQPVYVRAGLAWEAQERAALTRLLATAPFTSGVARVQDLVVTTEDLYPPDHWALAGRPPAYDTADSEVYLPGRNLMLLSKAAVFCSLHAVARLVIGPLAGNPFPDATPEFFAAMARAASLGLAFELSIEAPFAGKHKVDVITLGMELGVRLDLTLSCMQPTAGGLHCGLCNKCRERRDAFADAGLRDLTVYAAPSPR